MPSAIIHEGEVVWGRWGKSSPTWYPAIVVDSLIRQGTGNKYIWIFWLTEQSLSKVGKTMVEPFWTNFRSRVSKNKENSNIQKGISLGLKICAERAGVDLSNFTDLLTQWGLDDTTGFLSLANPDAYLPDPDAPYPGFIVDAIVGGFQEDILGQDINIEKPNDVQETPEQRSSNYDHVVTIEDNPTEQLVDMIPGSSNNEDDVLSISSGKNETRLCLACRKPAIEGVDHPLFEGILCTTCQDTWKVTFYAVDLDHCKLFCVICCQPGKLYVCDNPACGKCYCCKCVERYTDVKTNQKVAKSKHWECFLCSDYAVSTHGMLIPRKDWQIEVILIYSVGPRPVCDLHYLTGTSKRRIRVLSLFDGIGTGCLSLKLLGLQPEVYYSSEINKQALLISRVHHPDIINIGDAKKITSKMLKRLCPIDLVIGGPPCNDLSLVNHRRRGFNGTGKLLLRFIKILKLVQAYCCHSNHVFWLMENTRCMLKSHRQLISKLLGVEAVVWDAKDFSGHRRARLFWGNIPGMFSPADVCRKLEEEKTDLQSALCRGRTALVSHTRTITTNRNSLSRHSGTKGGIIVQHGEDVTLGSVEIERLFGFPDHYTDFGSFDHDHRQRLLGKAWSVPVIKHLLSPLMQYFQMDF